MFEYSVGYPLTSPSYFKNVTGFRYIRNFLQSTGPEDRHYFINYLEQVCTKLINDDDFATL